MPTTADLRACLANGLDIGNPQHRLAIEQAISEAAPALVIFDSLRR